MARTALGVLLVGMIVVAANRVAAAEARDVVSCPLRERIPNQLRPLDCRMVTVVMSGIARSATFQRLVERVSGLNGIVYLEARYYVHPRTRQVLSGALSHRVTLAGAHRVLHLMVAPESGDRSITTLAHELQHAIEVLEASDAATEPAVDRLFDRIGMHAGTGVVETQAALDAERAVARELSTGSVPRHDHF